MLDVIAEMALHLAKYISLFDGMQHSAAASSTMATVTGL